ncbi:hypothetical protein D3C85_1750000 [compost metagenome]
MILSCLEAELDIVCNRTFRENEETAARHDEIISRSLQHLHHQITALAILVLGDAQ